MRVTFADAYDQIANGSSNARNYVDWWRTKYATIRPAVESFVHERLWTISSADVASTLERGGHALGEIEKDREIRAVEDLRMPPTAVQDLFHNFVEREATLPTWEDFRLFLLEPKQKALMLDPWWRDLKPQLRSYDRDRVRDAIRWRLARMYYSNMREVDFVSRMREKHDLWLKYHIFADVRLRTDFWIGNHNISVFLSNQLYRGGGSNRKSKAQAFLADRNPAFMFHEVEFPNQYDRGKLYRVSDEAIDKLAEKIADRA